MAHSERLPTSGLEKISRHVDSTRRAASGRGTGWTPYGAVAALSDSRVPTFVRSGGGGGGSAFFT